MKRNSRILSLLLAASMLLPTLTACSENASEEAAEEPAQTAAEEAVPADAAAEEDEGFDRTKVKDNLPDGLDFGGASFTILDRNNGDGPEHNAEEVTGEVVNDAIFNRNKSVEERLNVSYSVLIRSTWDTYTTELQNIRRDIQAGDEVYQVINGYSIHIVTLPADMYQELSGMKYIDFSMPWWRKNIIDEMTIHGKTYFASGDINLSSIFSSNAAFFNKKVQENYGVENLYETVRDGRWSLDRMSAISGGIYVDLNGDGVRNDADLYGLVTTSMNSMDGLMGGFRQKVTEFNEEGLPELCMNTERMADIVSRVYALTYENEGVFRIPGDDGALMYKMFTNDQALFTLYPLYASLNYVREMESDYGILPTPKFEETQEEYGSYLQDGHTLICVPITTTDTDMTSAVLEALAAEGYRYVVPAYFDTALSKKYARDPETVEMLEIIRESCHYNFGYVCCREAFFTLRTMINEGQSDFVSRYKRNEKIWTKQLENMLKNYEE